MPINTQEKLFNILVVDDAALNIRIISECVSDLARVTVANNGDLAISLAIKEQPDLILLDIEMPGMNGLEVCRALKANPLTKSISIIFVTSLGQTDIQLEAFALGSVDYIQKPINRLLLNSRVRMHLSLIKRTKDLIAARNDLSKMIATLPVFISHWSLSLHNTYNNDVQGDWFGLRSKDIIGQSLQTLFKSNVFDSMQDVLARVEQKQNVIYDVELQSKFDTTIFAQISFIGDRQFQNVDGFLMIISDITDRKCEEIKLRKEKDQYTVTLRSIGDGVIATDANGLITFINPIAEELTQWSNAEAIGCPIEQVMQLQDMLTKEPLTNPIRVAIAENVVVKMPLDAVLVSKDNNHIDVEDSAAPIINDEGNMVGAIIVFHDVTESKAIAAKASYLASYDPLTNLPNRLLLLDRTKQAIKNAARDHNLCAMLVLNIDDFQGINNTYGFTIGDQLLINVAEFLQRFLRESDTLSRHSADEFVILMSDVKEDHCVADLSRRLLESLSTEWQVLDYTFNITFSIGAAIAPTDSTTAQSLYRHADTAMHEAKRNGKNSYKFFSKEIETAQKNQYQDIQRLREAIENDEIRVFYQPQINGLNQRVFGCEALARWIKEDGTMVFPDIFIPLAERSKLIIPLGISVMRQACKQAVIWQKNNPKFSMSVNISPIQFNQSLISTVTDILAETGMPAKTLELEITESTLLNDKHSRQTFLALKSLGVKICMDDFGTGYSSLAYIKKFPLDVIKIDQSFVLNMLDDMVDITIIETIIKLAKNLGLELIAEGVETEAHAQALLKMQCLKFQGYHYSKPLPAAELSEFLKR